MVKFNINKFKIDVDKLKTFGNKYWKDMLYISGLIVLSYFAFKNCSGNSESNASGQGNSVQHHYELVNCPGDTTNTVRTVSKDGKIVMHQLFFEKDCPNYNVQDTVLYNIVQRDSVIYNVKKRTKYKDDVVKRQKTVYVNDTVRNTVYKNDTVRKKVYKNDTIRRTVIFNDTIRRKYYVTDTIHKSVPASGQTQSGKRDGFIMGTVSTYTKSGCR